MMLNEVLMEAAKLAHADRRARIRRCVSEGKHQWESLPRCVEPSRQQIAHYCDHCWSVIDRDGRTWNWPPAQSA